MYILEKKTDLQCNPSFNLRKGGKEKQEKHKLSSRTEITIEQKLMKLKRGN